MDLEVRRVMCLLGSDQGVIHLMDFARNWTNYLRYGVLPL